MRGDLALKKSTLALLLIVLFQTSIAAEQDVDDGIVEDIQEEDKSIDSGNGDEIIYTSPQVDPKQFFYVDNFDNVEESRKRWIKSQAKKDDIAEEIAKYDGKWAWESPQRIVWKNDIGLVLKSQAKHAAIASRLLKPFTFQDEKPLLVQYEVTLQDGQECGGAYIKLLSAGKHTEDLTKFNDKTPYTIMFGPDKCGNDIKMHFIFRHVNPINGSISEKHASKPKDRLEEPFKDKLPHLYQLLVNPDNTFEMRVDHKVINSGSLLSDFTPAVNPPKEIDDPKDKKPEHWDEREKIPDPTAVKPEDWDDDAPPQIPDPTAVKPADWLDDEPEMIRDPTATKPEDWDTEMDGEWEAPLIDNPVCEKVSGCGQWDPPLIANKEYKGKWRAPMIDNPNYQGKWAPRKIANPDFFEDLNPFKMTPIDAIGIELWSMSSDILFDNIIITDDIEVAREYASQTFDLKRKHIDKESSTFLNQVMKYIEENPWFWQVALVVVVSLLAFILYRVCSKGGKKEAAENAAKKTDAVQEDDERNIDVKETMESSPKKKKSDLDVKEHNTTNNGGSRESEDRQTPTVEDVEDEQNSDEGAAAVRKRRVPKE